MGALASPGLLPPGALDLATDLMRHCEMSIVGRAVHQQRPVDIAARRPLTAGKRPEHHEGRVLGHQPFGADNLGESLSLCARGRRRLVEMRPGAADTIGKPLENTMLVGVCVPVVHLGARG